MIMLVSEPTQRYIAAIMAAPGPVNYSTMLADLKAKRAEIDAAIAAVERLVASGLGGVAAPVHQEGPKEKAKPNPHAGSPENMGPYFGLSRIEASLKCLELAGHPLSPREIWAALEATNYPIVSQDPAKNVQWDLKQRSEKKGDVFLIGFGKWGLRDWYTPEEIESFRRALGPTSGRDHALHMEKTRAGMAAQRANGVRVGAERKMTPEVITRAEELLSQGMTIKEVAKALDVATSSVTGNGLRARELRKRRRAEELAKIEDAEKPKQLRLVK